MDKDQLRARWQTLRTARIAVLAAALICIGMDAAAGGRGGFLGQVGVICLLVLLVVGLWERRTRIKAGIENGKQPSPASTTSDRKDGAS